LAPRRYLLTSGPRLGSGLSGWALRPGGLPIPGSSVCRCAARWRCTVCATAVCIPKSTMFLLSLRSAGSGDAASALVISAHACSAPEGVARNAGPGLCSLRFLPVRAPARGWRSHGWKSKNDPGCQETENPSRINNLGPNVYPDGTPADVLEQRHMWSIIMLKSRYSPRQRSLRPFSSCPSPSTFPSMRRRCHETNKN